MTAKVLVAVGQIALAFKRGDHQAVVATNLEGLMKLQV